MQRKIETCMTEMPHTVGEESSAEKASQMMHEFNCHHLPVLNGGKLVGVISARDLQLATQMGDLADVKVSSLMNDDPFVVMPDETVKVVVDKMISNGYGSAIVSASETSTWGIFTVSDALKLLRDLL